MPKCDVFRGTSGHKRCDHQARVSYRHPDYPKSPPGYRCDKHRRWLGPEIIVQELNPKKGKR